MPEMAFFLRFGLLKFSFFNFEIPTNSTPAPPHIRVAGHCNKFPHSCFSVEIALGGPISRSPQIFTPKNPKNNEPPLVIFPVRLLFICKEKKPMYNYQNTLSTQQTNQYKRTSRHPSDETRAKISASLKGRAKSPVTCQKLSDSLRAYWSQDENFPDDPPRPETGNGWND